MPLPDFLVIGVQKAGTSSLFGALCRHPEIQEPARKEVHFFDREWPQGVDWYREQFTGPVTGEATPYYVFHPLALERMQAVVPDARLVLLLRDPVQRAVSHYWHEVRLGHEDRSLEDALAAEEERLAGEEERIRADAGYRGWALQHFSYCARGDYVPQLRRLFALYTRRQVQVICFEDLVADSRRVFDDLAAFLGVGPFPPEVELPAMNVGRYDTPSPAAVEVLERRFAGWSAAVDEVLAGR